MPLYSNLRDPIIGSRETLHGRIWAQELGRRGQSPTAAAISPHIRAINPSIVQIVTHIDPAESDSVAALEPHERRVQVIHVEGPAAIALIPAYAPDVHAFPLDSARPNARWQHVQAQFSGNVSHAVPRYLGHIGQQ
ncbi:hypothetical protein [Sphingomonas aurantiaca]|uniref:hypothetical protein n=1 Tax=Sphingomonas aurantiaca TaxID=185949 RepID=UPI001ABF6CD5|nr:hypothetical protein [Sphingomonas aurantiaca]